MPLRSLGRIQGRLETDEPHPPNASPFENRAPQRTPRVPDAHRAREKRPLLVPPGAKFSVRAQLPEPDRRGRLRYPLAVRDPIGSSPFPEASPRSPNLKFHPAAWIRVRLCGDFFGV